MGKRPTLKIRSKSYRGVSALPLPQRSGEPNERGLFDLRPMRFATLDGASATEILTELVNLPNDPDSPKVQAFIEKHLELALGGADSGGLLPRRMPASEVMRLRGLYREFWKPLASADARGIVIKKNPQLNKSDGEDGYFQDPEEVRAAIAAQDPVELRKAVANAQKDRGARLGSLKASIFMGLLGPDRRAFQSSISHKPETDRGESADQNAIYPYLDYRHSALRMNWKTGTFTILARGPIDHLTHAVFQNRNRLRECPSCRRLFVAFGSNELFCPFGCRLERARERKRKDATRRRAALRVGGLTSRGHKPKRK